MFNAKERSRFGATPLHVATAANQLGAISELVRLGARIDTKDDEGETSLMHAVTKSRSEDTVRLLLDLGAAVDEQDHLGATALDWAAFYGNERLVALLLERGANPNAERRGKKAAPVGRSIHGGNVKVLQLLLGAKASVDTPIAGRTPLQDAATEGRDEFVRLLLNAGADPNARDSKGFTPLMSAVASRHVKIVQMLLEARADVMVQDNSGETAPDIARDIKRKDMIELLEKAGGRRGMDMPKQESAKTETELSWQLCDDSELSACIDPWPPVPGNATLKVTVSSEPELEGGWEIQYRIRSESQPNEPWTRMFPAIDDSDSDQEQFEALVHLKPGTWLVELRVLGRMHKEPDVLSDWRITVQ